METPETQVKRRAPRSNLFTLSRNNLVRWNETFAPSNAKISDIVRALLTRKHWSIPFFCSIYSLPESQIIRLLKKPEEIEISTVLRRLLWMICIFDQTPEVLTNPTKIASWAAIEMEGISRRKKVTSQRIWNITDELKKLKDDPLHSPMTLADIGERWHLPRHLVVKITNKAGYIPARGTLGERRFFLHHPVVREINWNMSNHLIGDLHPEYTRATFRAWRRKIALIPRDRLMAIIVDLKLDATHYAPFFGPYKKIVQKKLKNKLTTPEDVVGSQQNETAKNVVEERFGGIGQPTPVEAHGQTGSIGQPEGVGDLSAGSGVQAGRVEVGGVDLPISGGEAGEVGAGAQSGEDQMAPAD